MEQEEFLLFLGELQFEQDKIGTVKSLIYSEPLSDEQYEALLALDFVRADPELSSELEPLDSVLVERLLDERGASVDYFSGPNKQTRELWIVENFLKVSRVRYIRADLVPSPQDPPDVLVKRGCFELKELMDPGRKRHQEYKEALKRLSRPIRKIELLERRPVRTLSHVEVAEMIKSLLKELQLKYPPRLRIAMDLLVYVNLQDVFGIDGHLPPSIDFRGFGWRSVSAVTGTQAWTYQVRKDAPRWLVNRVGRISSIRKGNI